MVVDQAGVDQRVFRTAMSRLATGVTVVSTRRGDRHELMTANAVASISLRPALLMVSVANTARWLEAVRRTRLFAVNVLDRNHERLARWCADRARHSEPDRVIGHGVESATTGALLIDGALAIVECRLYDEHLAGDHTLLIGEVLRVTVGDPGAQPLVFFDRDYTTTAARSRELGLTNSGLTSSGLTHVGRVATG